MKEKKDKDAPLIDDDNDSYGKSDKSNHSFDEGKLQINANNEQLIEDRKKRRIETQPLEYPSAGSVFRNPEGDYAGRLIEEIGYKGKKIGGAMVSTKHANFIINYNNATGEDIKNLINEIKTIVKDKYGIELKVEQEFVE